MSNIKAIRMPKWGLAMEEGTIVGWLKQIGESVKEGEEIVEIETTKITNVLEATESGRLVRIVGDVGEVLPVGSIIAVLADGDASDAEIDEYISAQPAVDVAEKDAAAANALKVETWDVGGRNISVASAGAGQPIVLLHGYSGDFNNWMFTIEDLKSIGRVIAPDLPGHGASAKKMVDGSLGELAGIVAETLKALEVENAWVVGHSLGGAVAQRLALDHPGLVKGLVLVCSAALPGTEVSADFLDDVINAERARDVKAALQWLVADPDLVGREMVDGVLKYLRLDGAREALKVIRDRMLAGDDFSALQKSLDRLPPTLVIAGHNDQIVGRPLQDQLPGNWDVEWMDAGHLPQLEKAAAFNAILRRHFAK
ncbi:MAG TPA: acetoin dehydrogenase dihydrolipoyllysine-residue acetyltransferase subunit [Hyphomicrobiaceae bacterium]